MKVIKRNGKEVEFDLEKIAIAISKACDDVKCTDKEKQYIIQSFSSEWYTKYNNKEEWHVEEIQDIVEKLLMQYNQEAAKAFIIYRYEHSLLRKDNNSLVKSITKKLMASNVDNQNANVDEHSFGGRMGEATRVVTKAYALENCMSKMAKRNHLNNEIYIHDLDSYAVGMHNCYEKSTTFVTSKGIKAFSDFNDGDTTMVLANDGHWRPATIRMYGRQPMYEITLQRCNLTKTVVATRNHRWFLKDGSVTENIQIGDYLMPLSQSELPLIDSERKAEMFSLGFILGDGCDHGNFQEVKFCTPEKESYLEIFEMAGWHTGICNNYPYARKKITISKQDFLNNKMWKILSFEDKQCLFMGYLAADGSKTTNTKYIWTSDERMCELIEDISCLCGYHIYSKKQKIDSSNLKENRTLYEYIFTVKYSDNTTWEIVNISKGSHRNKDYEAWCLEEPITHSFTLEGGVITGNCLSIPFDDLLAKGFKTRQASVRPANSINTACQLVAVIFQIQSLQQFGGVSATHIDWTLAPYVNRSYDKHLKVANQWIPDKAKAALFAEEQTIKETYQGIEGLIHNLNTLQSRSGN